MLKCEKNLVFPQNVVCKRFVVSITGLLLPSTYKKKIRNSNYNKSRAYITKSANI